MDIDENKIDEAVLALLQLTLHDSRKAWKGHDWGAIGRFMRKGILKTRSVKPSPLF